MASPNRFLASLSITNRQRLLSFSEKVELPLWTSLSEEAAIPEFAFFLESGFASEVIRTAQSEAEVGIVGHDGGAGFGSLLGPVPPTSRCFMQSPGAGYRMPFARLRECFLDSEEIRKRILEYVQEQALSAAYLAACNKLHGAEARLARWLLTVGDRLGSDVLPLTQVFLAQMLGVRRMTVTVVAGALQQSGAIEYRRGTVRILDRTALISMACPCYGPMKLVNDRLYRDMREG